VLGNHLAVNGWGIHHLQIVLAQTQYRYIPPSPQVPIYKSYVYISTAVALKMFSFLSKRIKFSDVIWMYVFCELEKRKRLFKKTSKID